MVLYSSFFSNFVPLRNSYIIIYEHKPFHVNVELPSGCRR